MFLDHCIAAILVPLALWILLNGLDDLFLDAAWLTLWIRQRRAHPADLASILPHHPPQGSERPLAVIVPLWKEHRVIRSMVEHNLATQRHTAFHIFIGVYPNDLPTVAAVGDLEARFPNVHMAICPHNGPTSKADCLNWIYQGILLFEEANALRFATLVTHDAEDLIHPQSLRWIDYLARNAGMVQIPVLALPTPVFDWTHGIYCDDFAEFQLRDLPVRQFLGGFMPSSGVGTGFSRTALDQVAAAHSNRIFEPECLTEDYENGFRIHALGLQQVFFGLRPVTGPFQGGSRQFIATREYFPRTFRTAVRQRTRWILGIGLQSWQRHGWRESLPQIYWLWRDRKCLVGNLASALANVVTGYGLATWILTMPWAPAHQGTWTLPQALHIHWVATVCAATLGIQTLHLATRAGCSAYVYGWRFAAWSPIRLLVGNWINAFAAARALSIYFRALAAKRPLVWLKTEHAYPNREALLDHRPKLGEILVRNEYVSGEDYDAALASQPPGEMIGQYLMQLGKISDEDLQKAVALQHNLPFGRPERETVSKAATRTLPAAVARKWEVLAFRVVAGELYVAGTRPPDDVVEGEIKKFCSLEIRFHLITKDEFAEMAEEYLPPLPTVKR